LTVLKPIYGKSGADIFVYRTQEMRFAGRELWPANDPRRRADMLAQKFIDTGTHPAKYRMLVLFGRPLYCEEQASRAASPPVDPDSSGPLDGFVTSGASTAATAGTRRTRVCYDADVLELAPRTAAVFAEVPVLALDILREAVTGRLYVLETNPIGYTWHLSSRLGKIAQQRLGIDRYAQFDALSVAADALIEKTRAEAVL
jgi:glutathione synthase/RimK-type ligase-like ATP-grasp enzyme